MFGAETTVPAAVAASDGAPPSSGGYLPTVAALRARQVTVEGRTLNNVVMGASRDGGTWRGNVAADELDGYVEYRQVRNGARISARLARLSIAAGAASQVESLLDQQPGSIPALDVMVDEFELKGHKLGRLEIDAVNRGNREWRLNKLALGTPDAQFTASGNWAPARGGEAAARR